VSSTRNELNLASGNLSKEFYKAAGSGILAECRAKYPNGINFGQIAVTSSGRMNNCKRIYHASCSPYEQQNYTSTKVRLQSYLYLKNCQKPVD
jgi:hypothetical protein